jgi:hypothetical protein
MYDNPMPLHNDSSIRQSDNKQKSLFSFAGENVIIVIVTITVISLYIPYKTTNFRSILHFLSDFHNFSLLKAELIRFCFDIFMYFFLQILFTRIYIFCL